jgi:hypothetical protein
MYREILTSYHEEQKEKEIEKYKADFICPTCGNKERRLTKCFLTGQVVGKGFSLCCSECRAPLKLIKE